MVDYENELVKKKQLVEHNKLTSLVSRRTKNCTATQTNNILCLYNTRHQ